jgi:hypothetical protein
MCASATHEALGAIRVMPPCFAMGEAAGTAIALSLEADCLPRAVSVPTLQDRLRGAGAYLGEVAADMQGGKAQLILPSAQNIAAMMMTTAYARRFATAHAPADCASLIRPTAAAGRGTLPPARSVLSGATPSAGMLRRAAFSNYPRHHPVPALAAMD